MPHVHTHYGMHSGTHYMARTLIGTRTQPDPQQGPSNFGNVFAAIVFLAGWYGWYGWYGWPVVYHPQHVRCGDAQEAVADEGADGGRPLEVAPAQSTIQGHEEGVPWGSLVRLSSII